MIGRPIRSVIALVACSVVPFAAPGLALAHGHAHAELAEHAGAHHLPAAADAMWAVAGDAEHEGHAHVTLDPGYFSRLTHQPPGIAEPVVALGQLTLPMVGSAVPPPTATESPPSAAQARPQQPRAPPVS